jgi:hypothetical protein
LREKCFEGSDGEFSISGALPLPLNAEGEIS